MDHAIDCGFQAQWLEKGKSTKQQEKRPHKRIQNAPCRKQKSAGLNAPSPRRTMSRRPTTEKFAAENALDRQPPTADSWRCPRHQRTQSQRHTRDNRCPRHQTQRQQSEKISLCSCVCCRNDYDKRAAQRELGLVQTLQGVAEAFPHHRGPKCRTTLWLCHRRRHRRRRKSYLQKSQHQTSRSLRIPLPTQPLSC